MKKTIASAMFATILNLFGCNAQTDKFQSVSPATFAQIIADTTVIRLDVRTPEEYTYGHENEASISERVGNMTGRSGLQRVRRKTA